MYPYTCCKKTFPQQMSIPENMPISIRDSDDNDDDKDNRQYLYSSGHHLMVMMTMMTMK